MKAWKFVTSFLIPVGTLMAVMNASGVVLDSPAAFAVMGVFMTIKISLEEFYFERVGGAYVKTGREGEYRACQALFFSALGLGILGGYLTLVA